MKQQAHTLLSTSFIILLLLVGESLFAQNLTSPRPVSPAGEVSQTIALSTISVNYSRPKLTLRGNDRSGKIWGQQVAYGFTKSNNPANDDAPWRAGANENTIVTLSDDMTIGGKAIAAGSYGLHMAVYEDGKVTVIFSSNTSSWGSFHYRTDEDVLRVDVNMIDHPKTEVLTYSFTDYGRDYAVLALSWDEKQIPIKFEIDVDELVIQSYKDQLRGLIGFGWQAFIPAASYSLQNNTHLEQGNKWIETSISRNKNFQNLSIKAGLLAAAGKTDESDKAYTESVEMANLNQLNNLGYQMIGLKRYDKAIEFFELNVKRNPKDANSYDSLGEAYKFNGDNKNAIKNFKKALSLDPPANVKANSTLLLKELGVEVDS